MRGGDVADQRATPERGTGETTMGGEGTAEGEEEGETGDAVEHHLKPGIEVRGHQRGTNNQRPHPCTSKQALRWLINEINVGAIINRRILSVIFTIIIGRVLIAGLIVMITNCKFFFSELAIKAITK